MEKISLNTITTETKELIAIFTAISNKL